MAGEITVTETVVQVDATTSPVVLTVTESPVAVTTTNQGIQGAAGADGVASATLPITYNSTTRNIAINAGVANGVATLDGSGLIPTAQLPPLAINDTFVVASQAAMLALTAQVGDVAVRTDSNQTFILQATPASTLANWIQILTPPAVTSITADSPLTGGTITSTGTIGLGTVGVGKGGTGKTTFGATAGVLKTDGSDVISAATIVNADISASAAIADSKLATITTAGKVSGTAITSGNISTTGSITTSNGVTATGTSVISNTGSGGISAGSGGLSATGNITTTGNITLGNSTTGGTLNLTAASGNVQTIQATTGANTTLTLRNTSGTVAYQSDTIAVANGGTGATATTGTGNNVLDTNPTIASLNASGTIYRQVSGAPASVTTSITAAQLLTMWVTSAPSALQNTSLPTATALNTAWLGGDTAVVEWTYINTGTFNATLTSGTSSTIATGNNAIILPNTSARFGTRRSTGGGSYVTYRLA